MFKRARVSVLIGLIAATCGFIGLLDPSIAQAVFYFCTAFSLLSVLFGFFEVEGEPVSQAGNGALQARPIGAPESQNHLT